MPGLHPQVQALVDRWAGEQAAPDLATRRAEYVRTGRELGGKPERVAHVEDVVLGTSLPARLYRPLHAPEADAALVWFHGGGWMLGDLDSHDHVARALANAGRCVVVAVDYRLAPEHPFPAAVDDARTALGRIRGEDAARLGIDPRRVLVGGDSAGGTPATLAALDARDDGLTALLGQVLVYPALVPDLDTDAYRELADGTGLSASAMEAMWAAWLADADAASATPLGRDLAGCAPAFVALAGQDPVRDDGLRYARELRAAGVAADTVVFDDMIHGFLRYGGVVDRTQELIDVLGVRVRAALGARGASHGARVGGGRP